MKNILLLTDFSDAGTAAAKTAFTIARNMTANLEILHALQVPVDWEGLPTDKQAAYPEIQKEIAKASDLLDDLVSIAGEQGVKAGKKILPTSSIRSFIHALTGLQKDLIIMGASSRSAMEKFVLGSTTERMMRKSGSPVLVVKSTLELPQIKTVVFASGLEQDTHNAFQRLIDFARDVGAINLHFVEVTTPFNFMPSNDAHKKITDFLAHHPGVDIQAHNYNHFNIESGILAFARSVNADLIAIANHGRQDISSIFVESIPENLVRFGDTPVLSIKT